MLSLVCNLLTPVSLGGGKVEHFPLRPTQVHAISTRPGVFCLSSVFSSSSLTSPSS